MAYVGQNIPHDSARGHVTGASLFLDDIPPARGELLVDVVGSPIAHGRITKIDLSAAREIPGVIALFTAADIPGHNDIGPILRDEHLLAADEALFVGDPIVLIAAETRDALRAARQAVRIELEPLPPIFTVEEAIAAGSYIGEPLTIARGDLEAGFAAADATLEGRLTIGGQDQFYLESQIAIVYPGEARTFTVLSSTQHPTEVQTMVAEVLGVPFNHVTVQVKRMGGGFGGKETQAAQPACMAALVAMKTGRPARLAYTKDDDMRWTGKRHPFESHYRVGFTRDGRITALDVELYSNGGYSADLSPPVMERAMLHTDNAYFIPNLRVTGRICRTNLPSNTAFRGFGGPQGVLSTENIIEEIARHLGLDPLDIRQRNLYGIEERNTTHYRQIVRNNTLPRLIEQLRRESDYDARREAIAAFNATSPTHACGLSLTPVKFGISFTRQAMNQANALVNIYTDGTVLVTTGGTEMGQGVNTRVRQIVADELGIDYAAVLVGPTDTSKNNNTSPTAASSGTDLNGAAAVDACGRLRARLAEVASRMLARPELGLTPSPESIRFERGLVRDLRRPDATLTFAEVVLQANIERVSLGERGHYATPGVDCNRATGRGTPFLYFTNGAAVSEVIVDRFTGEAKVLRVDLLMDLGESINPGIDRGQITGGFIQGMGWLTTEELMYSSHGELLSYSPTTYKIPNISDVPAVFNVSFLHNPDNVVSLRRSKAVGEPPLLLGISVWTAIKDAIAAVNPAGASALSAPATGEQILMRLGEPRIAVRAASPATAPQASA